MKHNSSDKNKNNAEVSQVYEESAEFLRTLANHNRLIILGKLLDGGACVGDLEKNVSISQSALSQHLSRMRSEGIVSRRRKSQQIFYSICDNRVEKFIGLVKECFSGNN